MFHLAELLAFFFLLIRANFRAGYAFEASNHSDNRKSHTYDGFDFTQSNECPRSIDL